LHPLVAAAAVVIILVCGITLATLTGVLSPTQNMLFAAHAETPMMGPARPADLISPQTENKRLPAFTLVDSLAPGEEVVHINVKPRVAKPANAASTKGAKETYLLPSLAVTRVLVPSTSLPPAISAPANSAPRIIPVYRDMRENGPAIAEQDSTRASESAYSSQRDELPWDGR